MCLLVSATVSATDRGLIGDDGWLTEGILNPNFVLEPVTYIAHLAALTERREADA